MRPAVQHRAAKIGISTTNGMPIRLTTAKSSRIVRMGRKPRNVGPALLQLVQASKWPRASHAGACTRIISSEAITAM